MRPHLRSRERHVPVIRFLSSEAERLRTAALRDLLRWMLTTGQKECSGLGYPPKEIADRELRETTAPPSRNPLNLFYGIVASRSRLFASRLSLKVFC